MLYAISGSQGSGKSTIVGELEKLGYNTIVRKTSRSILTDWNVSLDEVNGDPSLTMKFQEEITNRKVADELHAIKSPDVWFTERTHLDLFVYALAAIGNNNGCSNWVDRYYATCVKHSQEYSGVFYLPNQCFSVESDGIRGSNSHYSDMVNLMMLHISMNAINPNRFNMVTECDIQKRIQQIISKIN